MERITLTAVAFDAGTQIREAINEQVVHEYAERMAEGVEFPPVVLFHDGNRYYLADGFHRFMAAQRNQFVDIAAVVNAGTKEDALWFALGANKANGHRMTVGDKRHAIVLALQTWPERSGREIAAQVGCANTFVSRVRDEVCTSAHLPDRVTGKDGKSYPASRPRVIEPAAHEWQGVPTEPPHAAAVAPARQASTARQPVRPPSNGMQFARIAVMKLAEIREDDTERVQAFTHVRAWLNAHE